MGWEKRAGNGEGKIREKRVNSKKRERMKGKVDMQILVERNERVRERRFGERRRMKRYKGT